MKRIKMGRPKGIKEKRPRFRRTKAEIAAGLTMEQAIEIRKKMVKGGQLELSRLPANTQDLIRRAKEGAQIQEDLENLTRWELLDEEFDSPGRLKKTEEENICGVKISAAVVVVDGTARVKIRKGQKIDSAPCEKVLFKINYEEDGIPASSIIKKVRKLLGALYYFGQTNSFD